MRVAYLTGRYPALTHTFVLREVQALRARGVDVETFSIWRTKEEELHSTADRDEWSRTHALLPTTVGAVLGAHVRAFAHSPRAYATTLTRALTLTSAGLRRRLLGAMRFVEALMLWDECRKRGLRHIHTHLDGTAPIVALLSVDFANAASSGGPSWSWSQTVHGSKEFYDVHRERLDARAEASSFTVCVSDYTRSQVMAFVPEELWPKLLVVRCGVDVDEFSPPGADGDGTLRILTIGRIDAMKGNVLLLQALARLAEQGLEPELTFVGDGPSRAKAIGIANELGVADRVTWTGAVGNDRIREFYAAHDVFCLPSFAEGVPIVLMEAMAMELPVVASAITGIPELVEDGVSGFLVRPGRLDELVQRLARLLTDEKLRGSMGQAGRAKVEVEYDLGRNAQELQRLFADRVPGVANT